MIACQYLSTWAHSACALTTVWLRLAGPIAKVSKLVMCFGALVLEGDLKGGVGDFLSDTFKIKLTLDFALNAYPSFNHD